ncbi:MAG: dTDP-glucose 4,6-dehydratase [Deltaproteobacteria bacterium]|nr:dTDP-glucose 4,6-dehydratase [Deltaproteobacteria bacterium]
MANILVTGGAGFIGSNYVLSRRSSTSDRIVVLDALTYAGNLESLASVEKDPRIRFVRGSISDPELVTRIFGEEHFDAVVHFAAESHVDRSILGPRVFTETNVLGTQILLDAARAKPGLRFVMVSTDEVYGSLGPSGQFTESSPLAPSSPYSASKAAADLLALSYAHTFQLDVVLTRCSNNYGPRQFPEKLIPLMVINALSDVPLPVYGDGMQVRDWIHVDDHNAAIDAVLERGKSGHVYNIGASNERPNVEIVRTILDHLKKPETLIRYVADRPGHDRRYAIDATKLRVELGWQPKIGFIEGLRQTIDWYVEHRAWWERIRSGAYREYYERQYGDRLVGKK